MKITKVLTLVVCICLTCLFFVGCGGESKIADFTVELKTEGLMPIEDVEIRVYKDSKLSDLVWASRTNDEGKISFSAEESKKYTAVVGDLPDGYECEKTYTVSQKNTEIVLKTVLIGGDKLGDTQVSLGSVIPDFSVMAVDGKTYKISDLLKEKKAVVLNFWFLNCQPCKMEFPFLEQAYQEYKEDIEVLAINPLDGTVSEISKFASENSLSFPMAVGDTDFVKSFNLNSYPTTVVIDRYGTVSMIHKGSITDKETFTKIFGYFVRDGYVQTTVRNISDIK